MERVKSRQDRFCQWCGKRLRTGRKAYCDNFCQANGYRRDTGMTGGGPVPPVQYVRKPRKVIMTDAE